MAYTTSANISAYLQTTIDTSSTPTSTTVDLWITEADDEINHITKTTFEDVTFTNEILALNSDYASTSAQSNDGTGAYNQPARWDLVALPFKNLLTITAVEFNTAGATDVPVWVAATIGYGGDVILNGDNLQLIGGANVPYKQIASIRVSGTYGSASVPPFVQKLATRMVALEYIASVQSNEVSSGGGGIRVGDIEIKEPGSFTQSFINSTRDYIEEKLKQLGTNNVYLI
jgi:hypothetical protein